MNNIISSIRGVEWGKAKFLLLFFGLICKGLAMRDPLPFAWGAEVKAIAEVVWPAFDGVFAWLLMPPRPKINPATGFEPIDPEAS